MLSLRTFRIIVPLLLLGATVLSTSCTSRKKLLYLQESNKGTGMDTVVLAKDTSNYRLEVKDIVYISIKGLDQDASGPLETDVSSGMLQGESGIYLNSYFISDSGYVTLPFIGELSLVGLTIDEARKVIQSEVSKYLINPWVNVKLAYFEFTILGEVNTPGVYRVYDHNVNLLEAIAYANDLTEYGNRQEIMVIREESTGQHVAYLDISDLMVINDKYFKLMPNDLIYVRPYRSKNYGLPGNTIMSTFSTIASVLTTLASLYLLSGVVKSN